MANTSPLPQPRTSLFALATALVMPLGAAVACVAPEQASDAATESAAPGPSTVVELIGSEQVVFAVFSGATTPGEAALAGLGEELDLVFHSLEAGPFDPLVLRIPPIRDGVETAEANVAAALDEAWRRSSSRTWNRPRTRPSQLPRWAMTTGPVTPRARDSACSS